MTVVITEDEKDPWERITVASLHALLGELLAREVVDADTVVAVDSDPEGNGVHPVRPVFSTGRLVGPNRETGMHPDWVDDEKEPAEAICLGVTY